MHRRATVPARINIIGEHTDYADGLALPFAVNQKLVLDVNFNVNSYIGDSTVIDLWKAAGGPPAELTLQSEIPIGKGMSSSAALCVAIAICVTGKLESITSCRLAQKIEHEVLGTECGLLDQIAMVYSRENHATLIDFSTLSTEYIELNPEWKFKLVDSGIARSLANTTYRTISVIENEHVKTENQRVLQALNASAKKLGELLNESHNSLSKLGVSLPDLDAQVENIQKIPGVLGARMMGGGFGGMILVLVSHESVLPGIPISTSSGPAILEEFL